VPEIIRDGKEAYVVGREIGKSLDYLIEKICGDENIRTADFITRLRAYSIEESEKLKAANAETRLINLEDRVETLMVLAQSCSDVVGIRKRIAEVFVAGGNGVQHMTIHKCKGLECDGDVFLLAPEKIPHKRAKKEEQVAEEYRLLYVAITRAKNNFFYVKG